MIAFHGKEETKSFYLNRALEHQRLDEIHKGTYFEDGEPGKRRMCAVGCTLHSSDHKAYERELGVPEWLAFVEDRLFEGMSNERARVFPVQFLEAINVGADLDKIKAPFIIFILQSALENFDHAKDPDCKKAIDDVIELWQKYPEGPAAAWSAAWSAAESAAYAARSAARSAAYAAWSAAYAAWSAESAAYAARSAAEAAWAEAANAYDSYADELLKLMRECT